MKISNYDRNEYPLQSENLKKGIAILCGIEKLKYPWRLVARIKGLWDVEMEKIEIQSVPQLVDNCRMSWDWAAVLRAVGGTESSTGIENSCDIKQWTREARLSRSPRGPWQLLGCSRYLSLSSGKSHLLQMYCAGEGQYLILEFDS